MIVDNALALFMMDIPNIHAIASNISGYVDNPAYQERKTKCAPNQCLPPKAVAS